jgi:endonuclease/exonuclease/phosphatase family metal-dependent hydrolase
MKLRLMTWNVHRCVGVDRKLDVERVADVIASCRADIVALQELDVGRMRTRSVDQAHRLAELLKMRSHFHPAITVEGERYGDAILTTLPERLVKTGALPGLPKIKALEPRGALWVAVDIGGVELQVINTHLGLVPREQQVQVAELLGERWLGAEGFTPPAVLLGDFNALPVSQTYRMLTAVLRDAQEGRGKATTATFPSGFPILRIDHVFLAGDITVTGVESPFDPRSRAASDHLPLIVELEVAAPSP